MEGEIYRVLEKDAFFICSHSDLQPMELQNREVSFKRPANPKVEDRLRLYGKKKPLISTEICLVEKFLSLCTRDKSGKVIPLFQALSGTIVEGFSLYFSRQ